MVLFTLNIIMVQLIFIDKK